MFLDDDVERRHEEVVRDAAAHAASHHDVAMLLRLPLGAEMERLSLLVIRVERGARLAYGFQQRSQPLVDEVLGLAKLAPIVDEPPIELAARERRGWQRLELVASSHQHALLLADALVVALVECFPD